MRIALVVHDFSRAFGHGRYVAELATRFATEHEVHVFANTFSADAPGVHRHHVPTWRASALTTILSFYPSATLRVRGRFDIVHAQGFSIAGANVVTAHINNRRWMAARRDLCGGRLPWRERLFGALVTPLEHYAMSSPKATIIAVSHALRRELAADGVPGRVVVIPHGVDKQQFNTGVILRYRQAVRRELGCADDDTLFLFVGDLRKGFARAVEALVSTPGRLVAVSRSDPSESMALAHTLGVSDRVLVWPATPQIERFYAAADAFVFPTQYDAFGMVITEAMACGLPVITTASAGASDLIQHGRTGFVVRDPADVGSLAGHMRALAACAELRESIGSAAADQMHAHSWDHVAADTMAVYDQRAGAGPSVP